MSLLKKKINNATTLSAVITHKHLPFNEYTWLTAHNAFSTGFLGIGGNQNKDISELLRLGARGLMLDLHYCHGEIRLTHNSCSWDDTVFSDEMNRSVLPFLRNNAEAVVTLFLESYVTKDQLLTAFNAIPGLNEFIFTLSKFCCQKNQLAWPSLQEMIDQNQRLLIVSDKWDTSGFYSTQAGELQVIFSLAIISENYWSLGDTIWQHDYTCQPRNKLIPLSIKNFRYGGQLDRLFLMNHFHGISFKSHSAYDNGFSNLLIRDEHYCQASAQHSPNYIAVDFINEGGAREYVNFKNNGGVLFYASNNATGKFICGMTTVVRRWLDLSQFNVKNHLGCKNDIIRSAVLQGIANGTRIEIYDSPLASILDDYAIISINRNIGANEKIIIPSFEVTYNCSEYSIRFFHRNGLDGKLSFIKINPSVESNLVEFADNEVPDVFSKMAFSALTTAGAAVVSASLDRLTQTYQEKFFYLPSLTRYLFKPVILSSINTYIINYLWNPNAFFDSSLPSFFSSMLLTYLGLIVMEPINQKIAKKIHPLANFLIQTILCILFWNPELFMSEAFIFCLPFSFFLKCADGFCFKLVEYTTHKLINQLSKPRNYPSAIITGQEKNIPLTEVIASKNDLNPKNAKIYFFNLIENTISQPSRAINRNPS